MFHERLDGSILYQVRSSALKENPRLKIPNQKENMNTTTTTLNIKSLIAHDGNQEVVKEEKRKLTILLPESYHDVIQRIALLTGNSKTATYKLAIDTLAASIGEDILFPRTAAVEEK